MNLVGNVMFFLLIQTATLFWPLVLMICSLLIELLCFFLSDLIISLRRMTREGRESRGLPRQWASPGGRNAVLRSPVWRSALLRSALRRNATFADYHWAPLTPVSVRTLCICNLKKILLLIISAHFFAANNFCFDIHFSKEWVCISNSLKVTLVRIIQTESSFLFKKM